MSGLMETLEQLWRFDLTRLDEVSLTAIFLILFFTTFLTEDGACLAAGALAGQGRISFAFAVGACFAGIFVGDVGLYVIGRVSGNSIARTRLFKRFISDESLLTASEWLEKRGVAAIFISRFVAGLRLPTYFTAGFLRTNFLKFVFYFVIAAAVWTPLIVGSATFAQKIISPRYFFLSIIALYLLLHLGINLGTWKRRRLFIGRLKRIRNWEFWPLWIFYFPVFLYVLFLAVRHRSLTVFTCANPAVIAGGFIGESKHDIYNRLGENEENQHYLLKHTLFDSELEEDEALSRFEEWRNKNSLDYPFVVKPNAGERGRLVEIVTDRSRMSDRFRLSSGDLIVQEFVGGPEISVFYYRYPSRKKGRIFSVTKKEFPKVVGDGENTLEHLILSDPRAVALAARYFEHNHVHLNDEPEDGEEVTLIDIGTHSRGAIFKEGGHLLTEELERAIDQIVRNYKGFYFGRFDLRAASWEEFRSAEEFKIIELNGVTSESTNIYDKRYSLFDAYSILFRQWRIAFEIGAENAADGCERTRLRELFNLYFGLEVENDPEEE